MTVRKFGGLLICDPVARLLWLYGLLRHQRSRRGQSDRGGDVDAVVHRGALSGRGQCDRGPETAYGQASRSR